MIILAAEIVRFLEWNSYPANLLGRSEPDQIYSNSYLIDLAVKACLGDLRIVVDSVYFESLVARVVEATSICKFSLAC